jgi:hypothetical protein
VKHLRVHGDICLVNSKGKSMVELTADDAGSLLILHSKNPDDCAVVGAWERQSPFIWLSSRKKGLVCLDFDERGGRVRIKDPQGRDVSVVRLGASSGESPAPPLAQVTMDVMLKKPVRALKAQEPVTA